MRRGQAPALQAHATGERMVMMKNKFCYKTLSRFLRFALEFIFYTGLMATLAVPFIRKNNMTLLKHLFGFFNSVLFDNQAVSTVFLVLFGVSCLVIVRQLILIFKSVNEDKPFIYENAVRLNRIALCGFALFVLLLLKTILVFTPMSFLMTIALLIASFAALVFGGLFGMAVEYKSENDLTI